jgi:ribonuclease HI
MTTTLDDYNNNDNQIHSSLFAHPTTRNIQVYFDGLCQPCNPGGIACYAFIVLKEEDTIHSQYGLAAYDSTNNVAEYTGVIRALEWLLKNNYKNENIVVRGDSRLVINQVKRKFKVKAPKIIPLYRGVMSLISKFNNIQFEWIPREQNTEADRLSYLAHQDAVRGNT